MTEQPSTEMTAMSHETTGFCFCGQMHGPVKDWNEHDWAALRTHAPAGALSAPPVSLPTREQIAEAIAKAEDADYWIDEVRQWEAQEQWERDAHPEGYPGMAYEDRESFLRTADAVLALLSQPTPTAERCGRRAWPYEEYQGEEDACVCLLNIGHEGLHLCGAGCGVEFAGGLPAEPTPPKGDDRG